MFIHEYTLNSYLNACVQLLLQIKPSYEASFVFAVFRRSDKGEGVSMAKIRTFARIKPSEDLYDDFDTTRNKLYMRIPDSYSRDTTLYNRSRAPIVNHEFKYTQVFGVHSTQTEIYDIAAKNILDGKFLSF